MPLSHDMALNTNLVLIGDGDVSVQHDVRYIPPSQLTVHNHRLRLLELEFHNWFKGGYHSRLVQSVQPQLQEYSCMCSKLTPTAADVGTDRCLWFPPVTSVYPAIELRGYNATG